MVERGRHHQRPPYQRCDLGSVQPSQHRAVPPRSATAVRHPLPVGVRARGTGLALAVLAAGTCLVTGQSWAQGTIVHVVPAQPIPYSDYPFSQDIDLNGDGVPDFNLSSPNTFDINLSPLNNNAIISVPEPPGDLGGSETEMMALLLSG